MNDYEGVNYYITIPAQVLHDNRLTPLSRLIYGELSALANIHGYAWINNNGLANRYDVSKYTISRSVSEIEKLGYIKSELIYKEGKKEVEKRNVYILPIDEKRNTLLRKNAIPYCEKTQYPIDEKRKDNNTVNNTINNNNNNSDIQELINFYEGNFGVINQFTVDNVTNDLSDYGKELVLEAMKRSATNGKQYGYVRGILKNWGSKNVKTLHDIEVLDATFKKSNTNSEKEDRSDWTWAEKKAGFREV
mgnify:FL=1